MTTFARPVQAGPGAGPGGSRKGSLLASWLSTTDHKIIGHLYLITSFGLGYANSLEWVTSCPPPRHNFTRIPRIRSERPAFDLHYPHIAAGRTRTPVPPASTRPPG